MKAPEAPENSTNHPAVDKFFGKVESTFEHLLEITKDVVERETVITLFSKYDSLKDEIAANTQELESARSSRRTSRWILNGIGAFLILAATITTTLVVRDIDKEEIIEKAKRKELTDYFKRIDQLESRTIVIELEHKNEKIIIESMANKLEALVESMERLEVILMERGSKK